MQQQRQHAGHGSLEKMLAQLTQQHQHFLEQAASAAYQALASENKRLNAEVAELKAVLLRELSDDRSPLGRAQNRRTTWNSSRLKPSFLSRTISGPLKPPALEQQTTVATSSAAGDDEQSTTTSGPPSPSRRRRHRHHSNVSGSALGLGWGSSSPSGGGGNSGGSSNMERSAMGRGMLAGLRRYRLITSSAPTLQLQLPLPPQLNDSPGAATAALRSAAAVAAAAASTATATATATMTSTASLVGKGDPVIATDSDADAGAFAETEKLGAGDSTGSTTASSPNAATTSADEAPASSCQEEGGEEKEKKAGASSTSPSPPSASGPGPETERRRSALSSYSSGMKQRLIGSAAPHTTVALAPRSSDMSEQTTAAAATATAAAGAKSDAADSPNDRGEREREREYRLPSKVSTKPGSHMAPSKSAPSRNCASSSPPAPCAGMGAGILHPSPPPLPCAPMSPLTTSLRLEDADFAPESSRPTGSLIDQGTTDLKEVLKLSDQDASEPLHPEDVESPRLPKELWLSSEVQEATISVGTASASASASVSASPWSTNNPDTENNSRKKVGNLVSRTIKRKASKGIGNWFRVNSDLGQTQKDLSRSIDSSPSASPKANELTMGSEDIRASILGALQSRSPERRARKPTWNLGFTSMFGKHLRRSPSAVESLEPVVRHRTSSMGSNASIVVPLNDARRIKEHKRLKHLLRMDEANDQSFDECSVTGESLFYCLRDRELGFEISMETADVAMQIFEGISKGLFPDVSCEEVGRVSIAALVNILWLQNLQDHVRGEYWEPVHQVVLALRTPTSEEIVHEAARCTYYEKAIVHTKHDLGWHLKNVVSAVVILNMIAIGISVDYEPNAPAWLVFEVFCTSVFVFEVVYFWFQQGARHYFWGESGYWNTMDVAITALALFQVTFEIILRLNLDVGILSDIHEATSAAVMLRGLRAVRVVRLVKLVKSPLLRDLASMLVGFVIGIPSLVWVLAMFVFILCLFGLFFRLMFGPNTSRANNYYHDLCGSGDDLTDLESVECPIHYVYGEEFFGTVGKSMFTCFRFMLGDYDTRNGKSLVVTFSFLYGTKFDIVFVAWMIVVIFGIFNIITAIFVDTTVAGLKHNDVKRKHAQQYERAFVKKKLTVLLDRIQFIAAARDDLKQAREGQLVQQIELDEEQFVEIVDDNIVKGVLGDLDVEVFNLRNMFTTFDGDDSGKVTLQELVEGIVKLRGEPQKSDVIGCWVSTRSLHEKMDALKGMIEATQRTEPYEVAAAGIAPPL